MKHISEGILQKKSQRKDPLYMCNTCVSMNVSLTVLFPSYPEQADEYLQPLKELDESQIRRIQTAGE